MFTPTFIQHRGRRILHLDFTGLSLPELKAAFVEAHRVAWAEPAGTVRILTTLRSPLTPEAAEALKEYGLANRGRIRASAVVGDSFWMVVVAFLKANGRDDLVLFDDDASALDWLADHA